jgi:3-methyladenine DNA glycosylase AlkD
MGPSAKAKDLLGRLDDKARMGDIKRLAGEIKKDHDLAMELWGTGQFTARLLAVLIMDRKLLTQELLDGLDQGMRAHPERERTQLMDWLMANQLAKDRRTIALMDTWAHSTSPLQRRTYWYRQGRLRWMGHPPPTSNAVLVGAIEERIAGEVPEVQWAMNFTAGWIGIYDKSLRARCVAIGERTGLFKGLPVSKGCTPDHLPEFIAIESAKRGL